MSIVLYCTQGGHTYRCQLICLARSVRLRSATLAARLARLRDGIRRLLGSFTRVRGLVFGQYGEWSLDVSHLISISAARAAARGWRQTGFRSEAEYRGMLTGMLRRRVGLQVVRAFARQRLRRVGLVGIPRTEIDGWRERQQRDRTLGSRGSDALVRLSDVLAYAAEYRAHTPHGVMP